MSPDDFTATWYADYSLDGSEALITPAASSIRNHQPRFPEPADADLAASSRTNCPWDEADLVEWNDAGNTYTADGSTITLPSNTATIIRGTGALDPAMSASSPYGRIVVPQTSRLIFDDPGEGDAIELHTMGITVSGSLELGSPTCRMEGSVHITLYGEYGTEAVSDRYLNATAGPDMRVKGIVTTNTTGAKIEMHGKLYYPTWTRLAAVIPGSAPADTWAPTPSERNREIFLQQCVNWPDGGTIAIATSVIKDERGYHKNSNKTIAAGGVECVTVDGHQFGKVTVTEDVEHFHYAGAHEYQSEVALLTRNIKISGSPASEPTDTTPLLCYLESSERTVGWNTQPCPDTFLTGLGGHTKILGKGRGRFRGVEFYRMGMTNVLGRYPVHFHYNDPNVGNMVSDSSVHHSFWRAYVIHNTDEMSLTNNVAWDISGHAYYLEAGTEELNHVEYNFGGFIHPINGVKPMTSTVADAFQTDKIRNPADHTASAFYFSSPYNYIVGNAASGGFQGIQFPVLPEPNDPNLRYNGVVPRERPSLLITGNSVHSTGWYATNVGAVYEGGALYWEEDDTDSTTLVYNAGRVGSTRLNRDPYDKNGNPVFMQIYNTTGWLNSVTVTGWGSRSELHGVEVHDQVNRAVFMLFTVEFEGITLNCRTPNAATIEIPDPGPAPSNSYNEKLFQDGTYFSGPPCCTARRYEGEQRLFTPLAANRLRKLRPPHEPHHGELAHLQLRRHRARHPALRRGWRRGRLGHRLLRRSRQRLRPRDPAGQHELRVGLGHARRQGLSQPEYLLRRQRPAVGFLLDAVHELVAGYRRFADGPWRVHDRRAKALGQLVAPGLPPRPVRGAPVEV